MRLVFTVHPRDLASIVCLYSSERLSIKEEISLIFYVEWRRLLGDSSSGINSSLRFSIFWVIQSEAAYSAHTVKFHQSKATVWCQTVTAFPVRNGADTDLIIPPSRRNTSYYSRMKKKNVHLYFISRATNRFSRRAKRQTERQVGGRQVEETVWKEGRGRGCTKHVWVYISLKRELLKFSFWRECGLSIGLSALRSLLSRVLPWGFSDPPDVWISWFKWQGRLRETPTGPALPGFQRPSDPVAVGCQGGDGNVWRRDNLYRTEPRVVRLFD